VFPTARVPRYWLAAIVVAAGCTTTASPPQSQRDPKADFAAYHTFAVPVPPGVESGGLQLQTLDRSIRAAIAEQMRGKGYQESADHPDLRMVYETASEQRAESNPVRIGIGIGSWGSNVGGSVSVGSPSVRNYQQGSLVIRAVDNARNAEVWDGRISGKITNGSLEPAAISSAVARVMTDFPARPAGQ
jgi:hypothetical protein